MLKDLNYEKTTRKTFAKIGDFVEIPNLIQVQKDSYNWFVKEGIKEVFEDLFPGQTFWDIEYDNILLVGTIQQALGYINMNTVPCACIVVEGKTLFVPILRHVNITP